MARIFDECTQVIINQVDEIKNLVNEFSRFARLPQLTLAPQDLNQLVQETLLLYQEVQPRITLAFHPDPALPPLLLDGEQVKRMLLNLLDNALASIKDTGTITVSLRRSPADGRVELTVADTGVGVPDRDKVRHLRTLLLHQAGRHRPGAGHRQFHRGRAPGVYPGGRQRAPGHQVYHRPSHAQGRICRRCW